MTRHGRAAASVVLSPHPDDAVLSCWHVLASPGDVLVVNVFTAAPAAGQQAGSAWWDRLTGARCPEARMRERLAEDAQALGRAGRAAVNLGFLDGQYRTGPPAVDAIAGRVAALVADGARVYAPAGLGEVPDHDIVRAAALALMDRCEVAFYADLPHAIRFGWPASVTGAPAGDGVDVGAYWDAVLAGALPGAGAFAAEVHVLDDRARAAKLAALRAYRTQLPALVALNGRLAEPATLRYEATWRRP